MGRCRLPGGGPGRIRRLGTRRWARIGLDAACSWPVFAPVGGEFQPASGPAQALLALLGVLQCPARLPTSCEAIGRLRCVGRRSARPSERPLTLLAAASTLTLD